MNRQNMKEYQNQSFNHGFNATLGFVRGHLNISFAYKISHITSQLYTIHGVIGMRKNINT